MSFNRLIVQMSCLGSASLLLVASLQAQQGDGGAAQPPPAADQQKLSQEELDQMLAPIALYPDSVLSQIFMAATYPLEVVQAERWAKQNSNLKGDALADALEQQTWDPSVKSLVNFPEVLTMMSEKLDWTTKLGDAFLSQQEGVLNSVQKLRGKANDQGNLKSTQEQIVKVEQAPAAATAPTYITIESASPDTVYVPTYDPTAIYGEWWYPSYPPYYYYPPNYVARPGLWFGAGVACGAAWGYAWGHCDWHHGDIDIDMNRNTFVNNRIDRSRYRSNNSFQGNKGRWEHNAAHRQGTPYRNQQVARKYNKQSTTDAARSRDAFRGRADAAVRDFGRGTGAQGNRSPQATNRAGTQPNRPGDRTNQPRNQRAPDRTSNNAGRGSGDFPAPGETPYAMRNRGGAFGDGQSGQAARQQSQRGQSSRSQASRPSQSSGSRPQASRSSSGGSRAPARSGGGGSRGGGGGGRGGGGGGRRR